MKILESERFYISIDTLAVRITKNKKSVVIPHSIASDIPLATVRTVAEKLLNSDYKVKERISDKVVLVTTGAATAEYHEEFGEFLVINLFSR